MSDLIGGRRAVPVEQLMGPPAPLVYRIYGADRRLLYVGMTTNSLTSRVADHQGKPWWDPAGYVTTETFGDVAECARAERRAIQDERPIHNSTRPVVRQLPLFAPHVFARLRQPTSTEWRAGWRALRKIWAEDERQRGAA